MSALYIAGSSAHDKKHPRTESNSKGIDDKAAKRHKPAAPEEGAPAQHACSKLGIASSYLACRAGLNSSGVQAVVLLHAS